MSQLRVTIIDVGWGDSILLESQANDGTRFFGLIDSNDSAELKSSFIHVRRRFDLLGIDPESRQHNFAFILLTHAHADHAQGLLGILRHFGTRQFWYPKSGQSVMLANLLRYARRSIKVDHHQAIDSSKRPLKFGDAALEILWPPPNTINANENNNSIILSVTLGKVVFLFGGDAEAEVWETVVELAFLRMSTSSRCPTMGRTTEHLEIPVRRRGWTNAPSVRASRSAATCDHSLTPTRV